MKPKFIIATTIPLSLGFFKGQLRFLSREFDICAVSSNPKRLESFGKEEGITTHCIPMERPISIVKDFVSLWRWIAFLRKEKPNVVHGNTPKASMLSMLAARLTGVPVRIYMCHGLRFQGAHGVMRKLLMAMERLSCSCATRVLCVSEGVRKLLVEEKICPAEKCGVVNYGSSNGIDLSRFDANSVDAERMRRELGIPDDDFVFCFVGRVVGDKGVNELVGAFNRLSQECEKTELVIVGPEESELDPIADVTKKIIAENPRIYAVGRQSDVKPYMVGSNTFVLPSYREGFGVVLMEAGALGLPCITTDITGCNEIIKEGENGVIIPPRNEEALYGAMKRFVEDREAVSRMAARSRELIASRYEQHVVWDALLKEYRRLLNE